MDFLEELFNDLGNAASNALTETRVRATAAIVAKLHQQFPFADVIIGNMLKGTPEQVLTALAFWRPDLAHLTQNQHALKYVALLQVEVRKLTARTGKALQQLGE